MMGSDSEICLSKDKQRQKELEQFHFDLLEKYVGQRPKTGSGSTDCNIPFSMGIPSLCYGMYNCQGAHTLEESLDIASLTTGMRVCLAAVLDCFVDE